MARKSKANLLIIDDEKDIRDTLKLALEKTFKVSTVGSGEESIPLTAKNNFEVIICDIRMEGMDGIETLQKIKQISPTSEVIMHTAVIDTKTAVSAMKLGACDYITKPVDPDELLILCEKALEKRNLSIKAQVLTSQVENIQPGKMIGQSDPMIKVYDIIKKIASKDVSVLITGETGTGKELVAKAIHEEGNRQDKPFIAINCGGIPAELLESELFGYEKGAFTSAENSKPGKFELAHGGTIFLDEIGNMPMAMQAKLLRVLQEKEIERVGGTQPIKIDVRIIAATNNKLKKDIENGKFREDLYQRINVIPIELPPLRDREDDIILLASKFLEIYNAKYGGEFQEISKEAKNSLLAYSWPGNIRELQNVIQRIVTLEEGKTIEKDHLPLDITQENCINNQKNTTEVEGPLNELVSNYEKEIIENTLRKNDYNINQTASALKIHRTTLNSKITALNISKK